jgi:hypothetical protein
MWPRGWVELELSPSMTTALEGIEWSAAASGRTLPPGKDPVRIVQEARWVPGPVWTGAERLAPTGIRSPARPARSSVAIPTELSDPQGFIREEYFQTLV